MVESIIFYFFGHFSSFSFETLPKTLSTKADLIDFWNKISNIDKMKIIKIAVIDSSFIGILSYFIMFWTQSVVAEEKNPLKAFLSSAKIVLNDPINTFLMFLIAIVSFSFIFGLNFILGENILTHLLILMLSAYTVVYYTMMTFLYFERYR